MELSKNGLINEVDDVEQVSQNEKYRYDKVQELHKQMETEKNKYDLVCKKYKKGSKICTGLSVAANFVGSACFGSSAATSLTAVGLPIAIPLAIVGGFSYVGALLSTAVGKKINSKRSKHAAIFQLARNKCMMISRQLSKVLDDGKIDATEFDMLCQTIDDYYAQKEELRKRKVDVEKVMGEALKKAEVHLNTKLNSYLKQKN